MNTLSIVFDRYIKNLHRSPLKVYTVFPYIVAAATILFWKFECGKYSREETIVFFLFSLYS